ncbi:MAG: AAA family ATPase [Anaerolineae bacterium]|nr:AAA family ATPase [Anaerolineae bacterium]
MTTRELAQGKQQVKAQAGLDAAHILTTKLYIPPARANAITRPRLIEKLLTGMQRPDSFTLVSGPAGFGKTTLLSAFVAQRSGAVAWVSLDEGDNDPARFWAHLIAACRSVLGDVGAAALELLGTAQRLPDDAIPTLLINDLTAQARSIVLVLDDYHAIQNPALHASLLFLLEHQPHSLHVVISTRTDPPWPLARYRARNQLIEIRAQDLRFTVDETAAFLNQTMGLALSAEAVAALEERTEGWIAGLQLAALSLQGRADTAAFIQAFTGSHIYVAEYLVEEILQRQPGEAQEFLLQTAILERMNAALCEAVTGCRDGQAMLTALHRTNTFIIPLDSEGQWFRYHHLFADLLHARLRQSLAADALAALHRRASNWYEQHGFEAEAVRHALAASDFERAAVLVERAGEAKLFTGQSNLLQQWLDALPKESFATHPRLEIYRLMLALSQGTLDMSEQTLLGVEKLINALPASPENDRLRLGAMAYLCLFLAHQNTTRTIQIAQAALAELPEDETRLRINLYSSLYRAYGMDGDYEQAAAAYRECFRLSQADGHYGQISNTSMVRAFDLCQYGRMDEAARYCRAIIEQGDPGEQRVFYAAGPSYIGLAGVYLEWHDLETAEAYLTRGLELCRQAGSDGLYAGYTAKARLHQAQGDLDAALEVLRLMEQGFQRWDFFLMTRQVSVRLAAGDVSGVSQWIEPLLGLLGASSYAQRLPLIAVEAFKLCLARIYLAQGELEQAGQMLGEIQATVEPGGRDGRLLEVDLLRALLEQKRQGGQVTYEAIRHLKQALEIGEAAGFVLLILEEGTALIPLLAAVIDHQATPDHLRAYAQDLLAAFAGTGAAEAVHSIGKAAGLIEPLTARELEVLQCIATGDSNQAIADQLVITVRTVKKHITNILGKLDASNRTQAVARARELGLIDSG